VDYRTKAWKVQPTSQLTAANDAAVRPATFEDTRTDAPEAVGGNVKVASFNVLNYFTETGMDWVAKGGDCDFFVDRDDDEVTNDDCGPVGPRGAAEDEDLARQQAKIVTAINALDADVLSLEEIENSAKYAGPEHRDDALATLVDALNADRGSKVWAFVPSPPASERPAVEDEDVIRTAFIYQRKVVRPIGGSQILIDEVNFDNAREPLAQHFVPLGSPQDDFVAIVNHFKSKCSGVDTGDGQGASNADRVGQAKALVAFADEVSEAAGTDRVLLTGDFNAYTQEDPMQVLYDAGYADIGAEQTDEATYLFGGVVGSLDHVLASPSLNREVTGADVWQINSVESVAFEYSRRNYNATDFYAPDAFRASDHDPLLVGLALGRPRHVNG
jgi:predicted extracellular nuclease